MHFLRNVLSSSPTPTPSPPAGSVSYHQAIYSVAGTACSIFGHDTIRLTLPSFSTSYTNPNPNSKKCDRVNLARMYILHILVVFRYIPFKSPLPPFRFHCDIHSFDFFGFRIYSFIFPSLTLIQSDPPLELECSDIHSYLCAYVPFVFL